MLNKQFSPYQFDLGLPHPYSTRSSQLFYPNEMDDVDTQAENTVIFPEYLLEERIRQYYEEQYHEEQQRRRQQQLQQRKQQKEALRQAIMIRKRQEERERMARITQAAVAERKRKEISLFLAQDQQRRRNGIAAAYLVAQQQQENRRRQQCGQEVEFARHQELTRHTRIANHRRALQRQMEEQKRKERQAATSQLMGLNSHDHSFSPLSSPSSKSVAADNDHDILRLLLQSLHQSNNTSMKNEKTKIDARSTNQPMYSPFMVKPSIMMPSSKSKSKREQTMQSPAIYQRKDLTQRECNDNGEIFMDEKILKTPGVTFHNCFNIHNEPKTSMSESAEVTRSSRLQAISSKPTHGVEKKKSDKKLKSSILIGDVEDASDDEYDEDPVWNHRRPSEGQWIEPVLYEMTI